MSAGDRDLAATHALGALPPDEEATVEQELARNASLAAQVEEYRGVVETLDSGIARDAPPPGLFDVVLSRIEAERSVELSEPAPAEAPQQRSRNDEAASAPTGGGLSSRLQRVSPWRQRLSRSPSRCPPEPTSAARTRAPLCGERRSSPPSTVMHSSIRRTRRTVSSSSTSMTCHLRRRTNTTKCGFSATAAEEPWRQSAPSHQTAPECA